jgi:hypothetical protein
MLKKKKMVEIRLWEFHWKSPYVRVLKLYSHVVFHMVQPLRQGEANIMVTLGRKALGPFGSAFEAYEAAEGAKLKLGMTVEELEVFMTRERKIPKGPHKGELETRIVPVVLFELLDVHKIRRGVAWRGVTWRGAAWRGVAWRGAAWRGVAWRSMAWRGEAWRGVA